MPNQGSMRDAITRAVNYCFDESHGYSSLNDGTAHIGYPDFDCGGLVGRCLNEAGFSYPCASVGTSNMRSYLIAAGFTITNVTSPLQMPQNGDIVVYNNYDPDNRAGHTYFYAEDVLHYTDPSAVSDNTSTSGPCRIEAQSKRDRPDTEFGDTRNPAGGGHGAYWQCWSHTPYSLYPSWLGDPNTEVYIAHCPWSDMDGLDVGALLLLVLAGGHSIRHKRRRRS